MIFQIKTSYLNLSYVQYPSFNEHFLPEKNLKLPQRVVPKGCVLNIATGCFLVFLNRPLKPKLDNKATKPTRMYELLLNRCSNCSTFVFCCVSDLNSKSDITQLSLLWFDAGKITLKPCYEKLCLCGAVQQPKYGRTV